MDAGAHGGAIPCGGVPWCSVVGDASSSQARFPRLAWRTCSDVLHVTSVQPEDGLKFSINSLIHRSRALPFSRTPSCLVSSVSAACRAPCALCPLCARALEASPGCPLLAATLP